MARPMLEGDRPNFIVTDGGVPGRDGGVVLWRCCGAGGEEDVKGARMKGRR